METNLSTNCSTVALTNSFLIRILGSLGAVSVATCLFALSWLFYLKLYKQFLYRLAAYQVMASLFYALIIVCQFTFIEYNDSKYPSCVVVGYLDVIALWMKVCFSCWFTFHLFCFAVLLKNMWKLEPLYVISSILVPIVISSVPLITKSYGLTGDVCWIQADRCGKIYLVGSIEQIVVWYGPAFILLVLQCIAVVAIMITVYYRANRKLDENVFGREQHQKAFRQLLPLVAYPIVFCVLVIPMLIGIVHDFASPTSHNVFVFYSSIIPPSWSFSAGLTLIIHIGVLKRTEITVQHRESSTPGDTTGLLDSHRDRTRSSTYLSVPTSVAISSHAVNR